MAIEMIVHAIAPDHCGHSHGSQDEQCIDSKPHGKVSDGIQNNPCNHDHESHVTLFLHSRLTEQKQRITLPPSEDSM